MKAAVFRARHGIVEVEEIPPPQLVDGSLLINNGFSVISAGTERARLEAGEQSLIGKARSRPDQVKQVIQMAKQAGIRDTYETVKDRLDQPGLMGYSSAGVVLEVGEGVAGFVGGQRVAAAGGGYANHAQVVCVPRNLCVSVPDEVSTRDAAFATVGAIALHGIHQANVQPGSRIAVIGLGLVGQLTVRMLAAYGCDAAGIDTDPRMLEIALAAGVRAFARNDGNLIPELKAGWGGALADAVIVTAATKSADPVEFAGQTARDRATVVIVGDVAVAAPRPAYYGKELTIAHSRSYGPGRYDPLYEEGGIDYPIGYVPWTERRNMAEFLRQLATKKIELESLQPVVFQVDDAPKAYELLKATGDDRRVAILLAYEPLAGEPEPISIPTAGARPAREGVVRIAAVGAGSFATRMLLPHLKRSSDVAFTWIASASGLTAKSQGTRFGFAQAVGSIGEGLALEGTDCVMILSRHDTHGNHAREVLEAGKALYCEKPIAITEEELDGVAAAWASAGVPAMAGFNRRFAPAVQDMKQALGSRGQIQVLYRVFAGKLPAEHWVLDPKQGGRIVGEVCHFVDTAGYLIGVDPVAVTATSPDGRDPVAAQSVSAVIEYADGSNAAIVYGGVTPSSAPKEFMEVAADGFAARMDDFQTVTLWEKQKTQHSYKGGPKGHAEEMQALIDVLRGGRVDAADFRLALWSSLVACRIADAVAQGGRVDAAPSTPGLRSALLGGKAGA